MKVAHLQTPDKYVLSAAKNHMKMHVDMYQPGLLFMKTAPQAVKSERDEINMPVLCYSAHIFAPFLDDLHNDAEERDVYI